MFLIYKPVLITTVPTGREICTFPASCILTGVPGLGYGRVCELTTVPSQEGSK